MEPYCIQTVALIITAGATLALAVVTAVYARIARKTLKQLQTTTALTTLPKLIVADFVYSSPWPSGISVIIKNSGFGPGLNIKTELRAGPSGLNIRIDKRNLGVGDTFKLDIYGTPIDREVVSSTPYFNNEVSDYEGPLTIDIIYNDIFAAVYISTVNFMIKKDRVELI